MSDHIYEAGATKTTGAAAGLIAAINPGTLGAGIRAPEVREIGVFNQSGIGAQIGIGFPTSSPATPTQVTFQPVNQIDAAGNTKLVTTYSTPPGAPSTYLRRYDLQAVAGAGVIFTWLPGEFALWSGATYPMLLIWQISTLAVTLDLYAKVAE